MAADSTLSRRQAFAVAGFSTAGLLLARSAAAKPGTAPVAPAAKPAPASSASPSFANATGFYRTKLGELPMIVASDGTMDIAPMQPLFAPEASAAEFEKAMTESFHDPRNANFQFNNLCVKMGAETVLFDMGTGAPPAADSTTGRLSANLAAAGIKPEDITVVLISHAHFDHLGGALLANGQPRYPNARHIISKNEHDFWTNNPDLKNVALPPEGKTEWIKNAQLQLAGIRSKLELVKPGDKLLPGLEILDAAGHTPGHLAYSLSSGTESLFIANDLMHNRTVMFTNPEWTIGFDTDAKQAVASRKKFFDRAASDRSRVFAYHLPWPGFGHIGRAGSGYRWNIEPWAW